MPPPSPAGGGGGLADPGKATVWIRGFIEKAAYAIDQVAGSLLGVITLLVFVSAILRYLITWPIPDGFDIARLVLGCAVLWGLASAGFHEAHIKVDIVWSALPEKGKRLMDLFATLVTLAFTVVFAYMLLTKVQGTFSSNEQTFDLRLPVWPFHGLAWAGVVVASATTLARLYLLFVGREPDETQSKLHGQE